MSDREVVIDGARGEGGGQVLRSSLSLSMITGRPFEISGIRAGRRKPGLMRQHLTAARAAAEISGAEMNGAALNSAELTFAPGPVRGGAYRFSIGSSGSAMLVLQTVLVPLLGAAEPSRLILEGGTHNPYAPPFDFIERAFLPLLRRMGAEVEVRLEQPGFYPAGGGRVEVEILPSGPLTPIHLLASGEVTHRRGIARSANLAERIAQRELIVIQRELGWSEDLLEVEVVEDSPGPGNVLLAEIHTTELTEVFSSFGRRGVTSETVGREVCRQVKEYLAAGAPVGKHLADQLLVPMAAAGGGSFLTSAPSRHLLTNCEVLQSFSNQKIELDREPENRWRVSLASTETEGA